MDVLDPRRTRLIGQHGDAGLDRGATKGCGETVEIRNHLPVVLDEHARYRIDLCRKVEEGESAQWLPVDAIDLMSIDVAEHRQRRRELK